MDRVTVAKIAFALAGVGTFAYGIRTEDTIIRWVGIGFVVLAFLLRFMRKQPRE
jgi:Na+(H+)/acetate symporter ActP